MEPTPLYEADRSFMAVALELAAQAYRAGEVPVGAIIVRGGEIIGRGYNATISRDDPTAHAEVIALREAAQRIGNYRMVDCDLYVTLEPCVMCAGATMHARIARVIYGAPDPKTGACGGVVNLFEDARLNHHTSVTGGMLAEECGQRLKEFFVRRRNRSRVTTEEP